MRNAGHPRPARWLTVPLLLLYGCATARAHNSIEGAGEIANGALHPLMTPVHVMILLGLGLLLGQQVPLDLKTPSRFFAPAFAGALLLTLTGWSGVLQQPVLIGLALCIAALVGLGRDLPRPMLAVFAVAAAAGVALDSRVETGSTFSIVKTLLGTWLAANALVFYLALVSSHGADKPWAKTGIRILGSWIFATALLVLAFSLRKPA